MGTQRLQSIRFTVPASGQLTLDITGDFLVIEEATQSDFRLALDYDTPVLFDKGIVYQAPRGDGFKAVTLHDDSGAGFTGIVKFGLGDYRDTRVTIAGGLEIDSSVLQAGAISLATTADVSLAAGASTLIKAANLNRREIIITNLDASITLRVGDSNAAAARGMPLGPGSTLALDASAAVYAWNPGGTAVDVAVLETLNV